MGTEQKAVLAAGQADSKLSPYHWKALWASMTGYAMDGLDMMILAFTMPLIIAGLGLNTAQAGFISTLTMFGAVIGGIVFGMLADAYGRVRVFTWSILIFSIFTGLCALSPNLTTLDIFRFISGLGLGGEFGIGMTLVSETWPKKLRSRGTAGVAIGFQLGLILATLCATFLGPTIGWRGLFLVGTLPALFAWWTRRNLSEPDLWEEKAKKKEKKSVPVSQLFNSPKQVGITIGLIILTGVQNFGFYGIMTWAPTMLAKQLHISLNHTTIWTVFTTIGMIAGIVVFGTIADKWGRKPSFITFHIASAVFVWIFFQQSGFAALLVLGAVMGFFVNGMMGGYGSVLAEHYTTEVRSTAENFIFNIGRAIGGFGPLTIGYLALNHSLSSALSLISGIYIIAALAYIFLIPETKGKELA